MRRRSLPTWRMLRTRGRYACRRARSTSARRKAPAQGRPASLASRQSCLRAIRQSTGSTPSCCAFQRIPRSPRITIPTIGSPRSFPEPGISATAPSSTKRGCARCRPAASIPSRPTRTVIELNVIALIGIILLIGIVKKNAIMMIDFALEAERDEGKPPPEAIYQACLLRFRPDHDDHHGGAARRRAAGARPRHRARSCAGRSASRSSAA